MSSTLAADPQNNSGVDAGSGNPSTPEGVDGDNSTSEVEVAGDEGAAVIKPAAVYRNGVEITSLDERIVDAVDNFEVPVGHVRKGAREKSFMYSVGAYTEKVEDGTHKNGFYFCKTDHRCRRGKKEIACKGGDRSNVNTHLKMAHGLTGMAAIVK